MASGSAPGGDQPSLHCECRRAPGFERGLLRWSFALLIFSAATLDAMWVIPAQRVVRERASVTDPYLRKCPARAVARPAPPGERELRVIDIKLMTPRQAAR